MGDCPEDVIVPVILLPGIMGSRLRNRGGQVVWDPDDSMLMVSLYGRNAGVVVGPDAFRFRERRAVRAAAARRKALLVGNNFSRSFLRPIENAPVEGLSPTQVARNWSSVSLSTYGQILRAIEAQFPTLLTREVQQTNPRFNLVEMPTYALGYNWSQSNHHSGAYAAEKISAWVGAARQRAAEIGAQCPGAILVTHSMGGFVARSACLSHGAASDVLAVFSTVMPTDGAPAAYKRFHFGFENPGWGLSRAAVEGMAGYVVLGRQGQLVTALLGHMPGAQELLPNRRYRTNAGQRQWLHILNPDRNLIGRAVSGRTGYAHLPQSNPYTEIYRRVDRMWRAAHPEWLYPEGMSGSAADAFDAFVEHNETAEAWHTRIQSDGDFHELTYLCHSGDPAMQTYDTVRWRPEMLGGGLGRSVNEGHVALDADETPDYHREHLASGAEEDKFVSGPLLGADWSMDQADAAGDRTVPASAGRYALGVSHSRRTNHVPGYEHEAAIRDRRVITWVRERMAEVLGNCELY
jgi:hypothetical protein